MLVAMAPVDVPAPTPFRLFLPFFQTNPAIDAVISVLARSALIDARRRRSCRVLKRRYADVCREFRPAKMST